MNHKHCVYYSEEFYPDENHTENSCSLHGWVYSDCPDACAQYRSESDWHAEMYRYLSDVVFNANCQCSEIGCELLEECNYDDEYCYNCKAKYVQDTLNKCFVDWYGGEVSLEAAMNILDRYGVV